MSNQTSRDFYIKSPVLVYFYFDKDLNLFDFYSIDSCFTKFDDIRTFVDQPRIFLFFNKIKKFIKANSQAETTYEILENSYNHTHKICFELEFFEEMNNFGKSFTINKEKSTCGDYFNKILDSKVGSALVNFLNINIGE